MPTSASPAHNQTSATNGAKGNSRLGHNAPATRFRQFAVLFQREMTLIWNAPWTRLILPAVAVPIMFAAALFLAVPGDGGQLALLGFLSILACIWMGSSLSLMSIVDERNVFAHERRTFLKIVPYVAAKFAALAIVCLLQVACFVAVLVILREVVLSNCYRQPDAMLHGWGWSAFTLVLAGWAALAMGLLISALAGQRRYIAGFLLPLAMMAQIVFSAQVAGKGDAPLGSAYRELDSSTEFPRQTASMISRFTISRWADIALRSFAYQRTDYEVFQGEREDPFGSRAGFAGQRVRSWLTLAVMTMFFIVLAVVILRLQEWRTARRATQNPYAVRRSK